MPSQPTVARGSVRAATATSDAAAAVPMMYGSASGLRSSAWNTVPAHARPAPTTLAATTLGSRSSRTIVSAEAGQVTDPIPVSRCTTIATAWSGPTPLVPTATATAAATTSRASPTPTTSVERPSDGPSAIGLATVVALMGSLEQVGVDGARQRLEAVDDARAGT